VAEQFQGCHVVVLTFFLFPGGKQAVPVKTGLEMPLAFFVRYRRIECPERKLHGGPYTRFEPLTAMNAVVTGFWNVSSLGAGEQRSGLFCFFRVVGEVTVRMEAAGVTKQVCL